MAVVAVVVLLGALVGIFVSRNSGGDKNPPPVLADTSPQPSTDNTTPAANKSSTPTPAGKSTVPAPAVATTTTIAPAVANLITNWEDKLDEILTSPGEDDAKLKQLYDMYPRLPTDGKVEVAQHLSNLVGDKDYAPLGKLLTDASQDEDVLDVLLADALNRPNSVKLPLLLDIAQQDQHPKASESKDLLELFLEEDYGKDWSKWHSKLDEWLKANPD